MNLSSILLTAILATCAGCAPTTEFATKYASDFRRDGRTVSVFGVYKDGRMNAEAWSYAAPLFSTALGGGPCESLYGDVLLPNDRSVAEAVDDDARADGVTDALLDLLAPAATGEAVLVVTIAGRLPTTRAPNMSSPASASAPSPNPRGLGQRGAGGVSGGGLSPVASGGPRVSYGSQDALEVSAALFSVREHRTVARVVMTYTGKNADEAMASFIVKLRAELPGMKCQPWNREVHVDADRVRATRPAE